MTAVEVLPGQGVHDLAPAEYHARLELSSTGVRKLLSPSCPAKFDEWRRSGPEYSAEFDLGRAAHRKVLGAGEDIVEVEADDWRTKAAREARDEAREAGLTPLLSADVAVVEEMAAALRAHPFAGRLFEPGTGLPEQTLIWREVAITVNPEPAAEGETSRVPVHCRALLDWLPNPTGGRLILPDYKSTVSASPAHAEKAMASYGYHIQLEWYRRGLRALGLAGDDAEVLLVMQEKTRPYLVTVVQPDATAMRMAAIRVREAIDIYAECTATGRWPGYADDVVLASLPPWETKELNGVIW